MFRRRVWYTGNTVCVQYLNFPLRLFFFILYGMLNGYSSFRTDTIIVPTDSYEPAYKCTIFRWTIVSNIPRWRSSISAWFRCVNLYRRYKRAYAIRSPRLRSNIAANRSIKLQNFNRRLERKCKFVCSRFASRAEVSRSDRVRCKQIRTPRHAKFVPRHKLEPISILNARREFERGRLKCLGRIYLYTRTYIRV